jgi:Tol biopolymer transport system component
LVATVRTDAQNKTSSLVIYPVAGGERRSIHTVSSPDALQRFAGITWAPDSRSVVMVRTTGEKDTPKDLWLVPLDGGQARRLDIDIRAWKTGGGIRLSADGRKIAFFTGDDAREVWALESIAPTSSKR